MYVLDRYVRFLDDKGVGKPPIRYLAAVENGLREHGKDLHAMGTNALRSREDWNRVPFWKNREAYIAICRYKAGLGSYHQWDNFQLSDFMHRMNCSMTFRKRHSTLRYASDSSVFKGHVKDPKEWSEGRTSPARSRKKKATGRGTTKVDPVMEGSKSDSDSDDCTMLIFDPVKGELVPVHEVEKE